MRVPEFQIDFFGHSYFVQALPMIREIRGLISGENPRMGAAPESDGVWLLKT